MFFFEKKNQKTFANEGPLSTGLGLWQQPIGPRTD
jgi:hypothetical protein